MIRILSMILLLWAPAQLFAQQGPPANIDDSDSQFWSATAITGQMDEDIPLLIWFDGHARFRDDASDLGVTIFRPGLGWRVNEGLDLWLGYARIVARPEVGTEIKEDRFWQQATYPIVTIAGGQMGGRTRLEQRFRGSDSGTGWRFRQAVRWALPLDKRDVVPVISNELFINLNDAQGVQQGGFDQNRLFVGAAVKLSNQTRLEAGYLNNILNLPGPDNRVDHNASVTLFFSI